MDSYRWFLYAHIAAGTLALAMFWVAAAMKKGTPLHRRIGQVYLVSMLGVLATGVPLCMAMIERGRPLTAIFLGYLLLITGNACWAAWRAIRDRRHRQRYYGAMYWILAVVSATAGLAIIAFGVKIGAVLFQVFGAIGVIAGADAIRSYRKAPSDPKWWLKEHYGAIIGCGVATHIAFLGVGLRNALPMIDPQVLQSFAWFGPLVVAVLAAVWLNRKYGGAKPRVRLPQAEASGAAP